MRRSVLALAALAAALLPGIAGATCPVIPFVFSQGSVWNADQVNANFTSVRNCITSGGAGDVFGPSSSVANRIAFFDNTTGKLLGDGDASVAGYYYSAQTQPSHIWGASFSPSQNPSAALAVEKFFDTTVAGYPTSLPWQHPALYSVCHLSVIGVDTQNNACRGMMAEGIDSIGGFGTFVEGGKFVGVSTFTSGIGGGAYGVIGWGQSYNSQFTVGTEAQTIRTNGADAPGPRAFAPNTQMMVGFLYSNGNGGVGNRADVGFLVNPFNPKKTSTGFACGLDTIESTAGVCFGDYGGSAIGLDLSLGGASPHTLAAVLVSNQDPISFFKVDGVTIMPGIFAGGDDAIHLGSMSAPVIADGNFSVAGDILNTGNVTVAGGGAVSAVNHIIRATASPVLVTNFWTIYTDSGDANKLKAKFSTGTTVTLGTP